MNCAELEILLCDYLDGTLGVEQKAQVEAHLAQCSGCAQMARDVQAATGFIERAAEVEPPPELLTRILFEWRSMHPARTRQPGGLRRLLQDWRLSIRQPRFAMGIAMTILSVSLVGRAIGVSPSGVKNAVMNPAVILQRVDDQVDRGWQKVVKFYQNMRLVYEIQTQLRDWTQRETELRGRTANGEGQQGADSSQRETPGSGAGSAPESKQ